MMILSSGLSRRLKPFTVLPMALATMTSCAKKPAAVIVSKPAVTQNLFPATQGSSWTFSSELAKQEFTLAANITSAVANGDKTTVTMHWFANGAETQEELYYVS